VRVFGAQRIMWSSNYPAHPKFGGIKYRLEESKQALSTLGRDDQEWILGKTALSFYPALQG
jgi:predicted TIM-barrel fold metal-dependent hydrolase